MYRIIYILFKHVKFQHNNIVKYNSLYSVCVAISQGLNNLNYHHLNSQCKLSDHFYLPANWGTASIFLQFIIFNVMATYKLYGSLSALNFNITL